jgi:hypothetical protein
LVAVLFSVWPHLYADVSVAPGYYHAVNLLWGLFALSWVGLLLTRPPLPIRLNRLTQEVCLCLPGRGRLYRQPWRTLQARVDSYFRPAGVHGYDMLFGFTSKENGSTLWLVVGGSGVSRVGAYQDWEYLRLYMEQGLPVPTASELPQHSAQRIAADPWLAREEQVSENWGRNLFFQLVFKTVAAFFVPLVYLDRWLARHFTLRPARWPKEVEEASRPSGKPAATQANPVAFAPTRIAPRTDSRNGSSAPGARTLFQAIKNDQLRVVDQLIDMGVDVNATNEHGQSALAQARDLGRHEIAERLKRAGASDGRSRSS